MDLLVWSFNCCCCFFFNGKKCFWYTFKLLIYTQNIINHVNYKKNVFYIMRLSVCKFCMLNESLYIQIIGTRFSAFLWIFNFGTCFGNCIMIFLLNGTLNNHLNPTLKEHTSQFTNFSFQKGLPPFTIAWELLWDSDITSAAECETIKKATLRWHENPWFHVTRL